MSESFDDHGAELLMDVLVGGRRRDDPEVLSLAAENASFRNRLEEMLETVSTVEAAARFEREVLQDFDRPFASDEEWDGPPAPGEEHVERILRALIAEEDASRAVEESTVPTGQRAAESPLAAPARQLEPAASTTDPARRSRLALLLPLAGAAAVLLIFFLTQGGEENTLSPTPSDGGLILGDGDVEIVTPRGRVASFELFRWEHALESGQRFEIRVLDPSTGRELIDPIQVPGNEWRPAASLRASWPDAITWEVSVVNVLNEIERTSERATAVRR